MPAIGMPTTLAMVLNAITVEIARPRSRYGKLSPSVALTFGKITDAPAPARADVMHVVGAGDVLVGRVVRGRCVARPEADDRDPELVADLCHRSAADHERIDDRIRPVRGPAGGDGGARGHRIGGPARRTFAVHRDDFDVTEAAPFEVRAQQALHELRREIGHEAEVELRARDRR